MDLNVPEAAKEAAAIALTKFIFERYVTGYSTNGSLNSAGITAGIVLAVDMVGDEGVSYIEGLLSEFGISLHAYDVDVVRDMILGFVDTMVSRFFTYHNAYDDGGIVGIGKGTIYTSVICFVGDYFSKLI